MSNAKHLLLVVTNFIQWFLYLIVCVIFLAFSTSKFWLYVGLFPFTMIIPMYCGHVYNHPFHNNATILLTGLLHDVSFAKPIGLTSATLLILDFLLNFLNKKIKTLNFFGQWLLFFAYALLYGVFITLLQVFISHENIISRQFFQSLLITCLAFPLLASAFYYSTYKLKKNNLA